MVASQICRRRLMQVHTDISAVICTWLAYLPLWSLSKTCEHTSVLRVEGHQQSLRGGQRLDAK